MSKREIYINNLDDLENFAFTLTKQLKEMKTGLIFLHGNLGVGKTTLVKYILGFLGWCERVKSPTYSLIELYDIHAVRVYHLDLYRIQSPEELYFMGITDILQEEALILVEWPERIVNTGVKPHIEIYLELGPVTEARKILIEEN